MAQTTTVAFNTEKARDPNEPVLLLELQLTGGTLYLSSRAITVSGQAYAELMTAGIDCELSGDFAAEGSGSPKIGNVRITLANEDDVTGTPFSHLLATRTFTNRRAIVRQGYIPPGGAPLALADCLTIIDGTIRLPEQRVFTDQEFVLEIIDGSYAWHKDLGDPLTTTEFPDAIKEAIGKIKPILYGAVEHVPCLPVDIGARSALRADLTNTATTIPLSNADGFPTFGTIKIDQEQIPYTGKSGNDLTGATRGGGSVAHDRGAVVVEMQAAYHWLVADHKIKAISGVFMRRRGGAEEDWVRLGAAEYTAFPQGEGGGWQKAFVRFPALPLLARSVDLLASSPTHTHTDPSHTHGSPSHGHTDPSHTHGSPSHGHTDPAHTHGSPSHGHTDPSHTHTDPSHAHTDPSHAHTDPSHAHSATGSHVHTETASASQLPTNEAFPQIIGGPWPAYADHTYNFAAVSGPTTAVWHVKYSASITPSGSTWYYYIGGSLVGTWAYPNSPPKDWYYSGLPTSTTLRIQNGTQGAEMHLDIIERQAGYTPNTGATTANVNSNSITIDGNTILIDGTVVSIDGNTVIIDGTVISINGVAVNIDGTTITVNGNTITIDGTVVTIDGVVVSINGTAVGVTLSGQEIAETVYGVEVSVEAEGYQDDAGGTYTGTPNSLIFRPADVIRHIGAVLLGWSLSARCDSASFTQARNDEAAAGIRLDFALVDSIESSALFEQIREQTMSAHLLSGEGMYKRFLYPFAGAILKTFTEADDITSPIQCGLTPISEIRNEIVIDFQRDYFSSDWWGCVVRTDATSMGTGNPPSPGYAVEKRLTKQCGLIRDLTAATKIADNWLAWLKDQWYVCEFPVRAEWIHLEPWDHVGITSSRMPGGWANRDLLVQGINKQLGVRERPDSIIITARAVSA